MAALNTTADKQAVIGSVQRDCMRLGPAGDWHEGDHERFFAVDTLPGWCLHNGRTVRRGGIKHETSGIFALDVNAGDQRTGVHIDDSMDPLGRRLEWSRAVAK